VLSVLVFFLHRFNTKLSFVDTVRLGACSFGYFALSPFLFADSGLIHRYQQHQNPSRLAPPLPPPKSVRGRISVHAPDVLFLFFFFVLDSLGRHRDLISCVMQGENRFHAQGNILKLRLLGADEINTNFLNHVYVLVS
jgi:hypothetical protein